MLHAIFYLAVAYLAITYVIIRVTEAFEKRRNKRG